MPLQPALAEASAACQHEAPKEYLDAMVEDRRKLDFATFPRARKFTNVKWIALAFVVVTNAFANVIAIDPTQQNIRVKIDRSLTTSFISSSRMGNRRQENIPATTTLCRRRSLVGPQYQNIAGGAEAAIETEKEFFISDAQFVHLGPAARILTEEFYSQKTNFITFQIEKLKTTLSLESTFPNQQNSLRKENFRRPLQQMIVACNAKSGVVIGFAEVDARPLGNNQNTVSTDTFPTAGGSNEILRSYMYNLAVDKQYKRKGVATELVRACEQFVSDMHDSCIEKRLYLRVRKCNHAAVGLYERLGYEEMDPKTISLSKEDINSGSLEDGELILFAKDLPIDDECIVG